jgi:integrase
MGSRSRSGAPRRPRRASGGHPLRRSAPDLPGSRGARLAHQSLLTEGPLFRPVNRLGQIRRSRLTAQSVALIIKKWALEAGFDPAPFAGHSLRAGLATAAAKAGKSERSIMEQTGHRSVSVVRRYIRDAELFDDNAAAGMASIPSKLRGSSPTRRLDGPRRTPRPN